MIKEVEAYIYGDKIGTLILYEGKIYFEYDKKFKTLNIEISPIKLHTAQTKELYCNNDNPLYGGLAGVFFDSLPDVFGMAFIDRYFESKKRNIKEIGLLDRLSFIGDRGMGAIEYRPKIVSSVENKFYLKVLEAKKLNEQMQEILANKKECYLVEELMQILYNASPLGGGRPKMLVSFNKKTMQLSSNDKRLKEGFERAIIKFDEVYYENESIELTKFEYIYMSMAKACGINTADFTLLEESGLHHLIIKRFDRDKNDNKIHILTASALLHKHISIPKILSYEELFTLTAKLCNDHRAIEELFRRMVFNTLSLNVDDHAKNFSFMMNKKAEWSLTPAYDITYSYGMTKEHLTTLRGKSKNFVLEDYLFIAQKYLIKKGKALEIIEQISEVIGSFEKRAKVLNMSDESVLGCLENLKRVGL